MRCACKVVATISKPNASFGPQIERQYVPKSWCALPALPCCVRGALMHRQLLRIVGTWEPASRRWRWRSTAESISFAPIQTRSHGGATKASFCHLQWQTELPRVTGVRKSLVAICVQALKVIFFQPVLCHSRLMREGFVPGHVETVVGRKGNSFPKEMAVEGEGF